jgi:hypothetical protein
LIISFKEQGQHNFFDKPLKVVNKRAMNLDDIFEYCKQNKYKKIGFTPWGKGKYIDFINKIIDQKGEYPNEISLFHLNKNDYKQIKEYAGSSKNG